MSTSTYEYYQPGEQFSRKRRTYGLHFANIPYDSVNPVDRLSELRHKFKAARIESTQRRVDSTSYQMSVLVTFDVSVSVSSCVYFRSGEYLPQILKNSMSVSKYGVWLKESIDVPSFSYNEERVVYESITTHYKDTDFTHSIMSRQVIPAKKVPIKKIDVSDDESSSDSDSDSNSDSSDLIRCLGSPSRVLSEESLSEDVDENQSSIHLGEPINDESSNDQLVGRSTVAKELRHLVVRPITVEELAEIGALIDVHIRESKDESSHEESDDDN